jgi:hypothetical protein
MMKTNRIVAVFLTLCLMAETAPAVASTQDFLRPATSIPTALFSEQALNLPSDCAHDLLPHQERIGEEWMVMHDRVRTDVSQTLGMSVRKYFGIAFAVLAGALTLWPAFLQPRVVFGQTPNDHDTQVVIQYSGPNFHEAGTEYEKKMESLTQAWLDKEKDQLPFEVFVRFGSASPDGSANAALLPIKFHRGLNGTYQRGLLLIWEEGIVRYLIEHPEIQEHDLRHEKVHLLDRWAIEDAKPVRADQILSRASPDIKDKDTLAFKSYIYIRVERALIAQNEFKAIKAADPSWSAFPVPAQQYRHNEDVFRYAVDDIVKKIQPSLPKKERQALRLWVEQLLSVPVISSPRAGIYLLPKGFGYVLSIFAPPPHKITLSEPFFKMRKGSFLTKQR